MQYDGISTADRDYKLEFLEHSSALTYRRCVTIVVHNYSCNWCNWVHRGPRARLCNCINYLRKLRLRRAVANATMRLNFLCLSAEKNTFCYLGNVCRYTRATIIF